MVSRGDDAPARLRRTPCPAFPAGARRRVGRLHPADSAAAIEHLETLREGGARYFVVPSSQFWWLHHYGDLTAHLEARLPADLLRRSPGRVRPRSGAAAHGPRPRTGRPPRAGARRRDLRRRPQRTAGAAGRGAPPRRAVRGTTALAPGEAGPPPPAEDGEADWILHVDAAAVLPTRFVDDFLGIVEHPVRTRRRARPTRSHGGAGGRAARHRAAARRPRARGRGHRPRSR